MSTIADMTGEDAPAAGTAPSSSVPAVVVGNAAKQARPRSIPLPTAVTAALVAGMFGLLYLNLNGLRGDIETLRDEMRSEIGALRSETRSDIGMLRDEMRTDIGMLRTEMRSEIGRLDTKIDDLRSEVSTILLDHTDRLARIETHLEIIRQPDTQTTELQQ